MRIATSLLMIVVVTVIWAFTQGQIIHPREIWVHPSGDAVYVVGYNCTVKTPADKSDKDRQHVQELLDWCLAAYNK